MSDDLLKSFLDPRRLARIETVAAQRTSRLTVVLDQLHNSHNISAVLRSADAFGLRDVHIVGNLDVSQGIALGTDDWLRIHLHETPEAARLFLEKEGFDLVVTAPEDQGGRATAEGVKSLPIFSLPFQDKLALVFGNEKAGVSKELFAVAKYHAFIPMLGFVESLNISVACAISLFASTVRISERERQVDPLDEGERQELVSEWLRRNCKYADRVDRELARRKEIAK